MLPMAASIALDNEEGGIHMMSPEIMHCDLKSQSLIRSPAYCQVPSTKVRTLTETNDPTGNLFQYEWDHGSPLKCLGIPNLSTTMYARNVQVSFGVLSHHLAVLAESKWEPQPS